MSNLDTHFASSDQHTKEWICHCVKVFMFRRNVHATARCMSSFNIVERINEDEIHESADMQIQCLEDAMRIRVNTCLGEQLKKKRAQEIWEK